MGWTILDHEASAVEAIARGVISGNPDDLAKVPEPQQSSEHQARVAALSILSKLGGPTSVVEFPWTPGWPPAAAPFGVLWSADTETGDLSQWYNSPSVSGNGTAEASTENPHSGQYSLKLIANGSAGIRMKVQRLAPDPKNLPDDAVYSAWYYIPFEGLRDNIFQFKQADVTKWDSQGDPTRQTRRMLCKVSLEWNGTGYDVAYRTRIDQASGNWRNGEADELVRVNTNLPINEWFHVEMRYVWGQDGTGRSTLRIDGQEIWDLRNISTEANNLTYIQEPRQWAVNHYLSQSGTTWIFIDDAQIASGWSQ